MMTTLPIRRLLAAAVTTTFLLQSGAASAFGVLQAYDAALQNDPVYRSAVSENEAGQQYRVLGRQGLLPSISASYSTSKNRADLTAKSATGGENVTHPEYTSTVGVVQLRQTLFNLDAYARYKQGIAQTNYSNAIFSTRSQEVALRVVSAYADAQYAEDQLTLVTAQRDAYGEQMRVNDRLFQKGEGTKTDMLETQARFDLGEAQVLEAKDSLNNARNTLAAIVGRDITQLDPLVDDFRVAPMQPSNFEEWKEISLKQNPEIEAARYAVEASLQEVKKNRAGHFPRVDLVASLNKSNSETINTFNQDSNVRSVGVQVSIPIYSGGAVSAATSQAVSNSEKAKSDLEATTKKVLVELRKQYSLAVSSASRIDALVKSVTSARLLVKATEQSIKGGVRINLDALNAQQALFQSQRDLAQARYNYLLSYMRLRSAAGTLGAEDLNKVATYFVASR